MAENDDGKIAKEALRQAGRATTVVETMLRERGFEYANSAMSTGSESLLADDIVHFARRIKQR